MNDDVNDVHDEVVDVLQEFALVDETYLNDVDEDSLLSLFVHHHYQHNYFHLFLSMLF
jgi:hypothetical protein